MKQTLTLLLVTILHINLLSAQWVVQHVSEGNTTLHVIKFYDPETGFAMGAEGRILKTTDSGDNWLAIENEIIGTLTDFVFLSADTLLATSSKLDLGDYQKRIYKSVDGGLTWAEKYVGEGDLTAIQFAAPAVALAAGSSNILRSADAGETWSVVYDMLSNGFAYGEVKRLDMVTDSIGYALGTGRVDGSTFEFYSFLLKTVDAGGTWQMILEMPSWKDEMAFWDEENGYLADDENTYLTTDGGLTWATLNNLEGVAGFSLPTEDKVVTVNRPVAYLPEETLTSFAIRTSADSGTTWTGGDFSVGAHLESVCFLTDSVGFVAGDYSLIMKTETCGGAIKGNYPWHLFTATTEPVIHPLQCYPNPASDHIIVRASVYTGWQYSIAQSNGNLVESGTIQDAFIDVSRLPAGLYVLTLNRGDQYHVGKMIKR